MPYANKDKAREYRRSHYQKNIDRYKANASAYREAHKDTINSKGREYDKAHREERKQYYSSWLSANRDAVCEYKRQWASLHRPRLGALRRNSDAKRRAQLHSQYVAKLLSRGTSLKPKELPSDLIALKRAHLKLTRSLKQTLQK